MAPCKNIKSQIISVTTEWNTPGLTILFYEVFKETFKNVTRHQFSVPDVVDEDVVVVVGDVVVVAVAFLHMEIADF